jgi:hypothetical protein
MANQTNKVTTPFEEMEMGFNRTQVYKEWCQPQINRAAALRAVLDFQKINQIKMTTKEMMRLVMRYEQFIATGDRSFAQAIDEYIAKKYEEE